MRKSRAPNTEPHTPNLHPQESLGSAEDVDKLLDSNYTIITELIRLRYGYAIVSAAGSRSQPRPPPGSNNRIHPRPKPNAQAST